jgi:hypothetical protein
MRVTVILLMILSGYSILWLLGMALYGRMDGKAKNTIYGMDVKARNRKGLGK